MHGDSDQRHDDHEAGREDPDDSSGSALGTRHRPVAARSPGACRTRSADPVTVRKPSSTSRPSTPAVKVSRSPRPSRNSAVPTRAAARAPNAWESGDPLGHRRHRHEDRQGGPDRGADEGGDQDPPEVDDVALQERPDDRGRHAELARADAAPRRRRMREPLEGEDEACAGAQVEGDHEPVLPLGHGASPPAFRLPRLKDFSMRSVIMKPPTTLIVDAHHRDGAEDRRHRSPSRAGQR